MIRVFCRNPNGNRLCCEQRATKKTLNQHIFTLKRNRKLAIWKHFGGEIESNEFRSTCRWKACVCFGVFRIVSTRRACATLLLQTVGWLPVMVILWVASRYHIHADTTINYNRVGCLVERTCVYFHSDQVSADGWCDDDIRFLLHTTHRHQEWVSCNRVWMMYASVFTVHTMYLFRVNSLPPHRGTRVSPQMDLLCDDSFRELSSHARNTLSSCISIFEGIFHGIFSSKHCSNVNAII